MKASIAFANPAIASMTAARSTIRRISGSSYIVNNLGYLMEVESLRVLKPQMNADERRFIFVLG